MTANGSGPGTGASGRKRPHIPVLLLEVLKALDPKTGETYLDTTFGAGGYTTAVLEAADCRVVALDRDPAAIAAGADLVRRYAPRLSLLQTAFGDLEKALHGAGVAQVDGIVFDIGVSSMQLDEAERGFSFQKDGPLDMRMFAAGDGTAVEDGESAADVVNTYEQDDIANILFELGEERRSRAIARAIVERRRLAPFERTRDLASLIENLIGRGAGKGIHPATRTFQALRLFVNDELGQLEKGLLAAERVLKPGGRLCVVTFHSLEDRIVKRFLSERAGKRTGASRHLPMQSIKLQSPSFEILNPRPLTPSKGELDVNPRARSARLRVAVRTDAPAFSQA